MKCPHTGAVCRKECTIRPDCEFRARCAVNGAKGGKKSRRKLPKDEASRIAKLRWAKYRAAKRTLPTIKATGKTITQRDIDNQ